MNVAPHRRAAARSDAYRQIAWCLGGLIAGQLALALALEGPWAAVRDPEYGHKLELIRQGADDRPLLLGLGSSRMLNGLRPDVLPPAGPRVFNFGLTRHGPIQQLLALDRLLRDGVRPRWVAVELTSLLLPQGPAEMNLTPAARHTWGDVRFLSTHAYRPLTYSGQWLEARSAPWYTSRFALMSRLWPAWVPWTERHDYVWTHTDPHGWLAVPPAADPAAIRDKVAASEGAAMRAFGIHPDSDRAVRQVLTRCAIEGIGTTMIVMPEAAWFRELYRGEAEQRLQSYVDKLGRECGVPVIDARGWCPDDDFLDGTHLLPTGAGRFSERFGREVVPLLTQHGG